MKKFRSVLKKLLDIRYFKWILFVLVILAIVMFFIFRNRLDVIDLENEKLYQYFGGNKLEYKGNISFDRNNNITNIKTEDIKIEMDSTPIYYKNKNKVILPENMNITFPKEGVQKKVNYYTFLVYNKYGVYIKDRSIDNKVSDCFLYDGNDLYLFIDDVTVSFDDKIYNLSKLSYIIVNTLDRTVEIYNKKEDKDYFLTDINSEVIVKNKHYTINSSLDYIYFKDKRKLLFKQVDKLNNYK